jgi:hypothetical protein
MKVWIAKWDVRNGAADLEVYASQQLAVDAVIGYAKEMSLLGGDQVVEEILRNKLISTGVLEFDPAGCYYVVEEHAVMAIPACREETA